SSLSVSASGSTERCAHDDEHCTADDEQRKIKPGEREAALRAEALPGALATHLLLRVALSSVPFLRRPAGCKCSRIKGERQRPKHNNQPQPSHFPHFLPALLTYVGA